MRTSAHSSQLNRKNDVGSWKRKNGSFLPFPHRCLSRSRV